MSFPNSPVKDMNYTITGIAGTEISHYDMDDAVQLKFGDDVEVDSESGQFYAYTSEVFAPAVLAYVKEIGGENANLKWRTYGGHMGFAEFTMYNSDDEDHQEIWFDVPGDEF